MIRRGRLDSSQMDGRPPLRPPEGVRMIIWPVIALEDWDVARPMARTVIPPPQGQVLLPDVPNWSWHEYGMRVGVWRFFAPFPPPAAPPPPPINPPGRGEHARGARAAPQAGRGGMGPGL